MPTNARTATITLGGKPRRMGIGFNEIAEVEDVLGTEWLARLDKGSIRAAIVILAAGLGRYDRDITPRMVGDWMDELSSADLNGVLSQLQNVLVGSIDTPQQGGKKDESPLAQAVAETPPPAAAALTGTAS